MVVAISSEYPILDVFWTLLLAFGLTVYVWLLIVVFRDLFTRHDLNWVGKTAWLILLLAFPIVAAIGYLIVESEAMGRRKLEREGVGQLNMDAYLGSVAGEGGYRGVRDRSRSAQAWAGPIRSA